MNPENELEVENNEKDYIEAINELKANTVSKDQYNKLKAENKQLLDTLVKGGQIENKVAEKPDIEKLRQDLFGNQNLTNLEYCEKALQLRDALIEQGEADPFLPSGSHANVSNEDIAAANNVADQLKEIVDYADGDPEVFTMELQRRMVDNVPFRSKK